MNKEWLFDQLSHSFRRHTFSYLYQADSIRQKNECRIINPQQSPLFHVSDYYWKLNNCIFVKLEYT